MRGPPRRRIPLWAALLLALPAALAGCAESAEPSALEQGQARDAPERLRKDLEAGGDVRWLEAHTTRYLSSTGEPTGPVVETVDTRTYGPGDRWRSQARFLRADIDEDRNPRLDEVTFRFVCTPHEVVMNNTGPREQTVEMGGRFYNATNRLGTCFGPSATWERLFGPIGSRLELAGIVPEMVWGPTEFVLPPEWNLTRAWKDKDGLHAEYEARIQAKVGPSGDHLTKVTADLQDGRIVAYRLGFASTSRENGVTQTLRQAVEVEYGVR